MLSHQAQLQVLRPQPEPQGSTDRAKNGELPDELASLKGSIGAVGTDWKEVDVNLDVSWKVTSLLSSYGIQVDLLPATVPID